jgi:ATP-dependent phosphofructokinase / diphosphate-dependent phosphofructokinase
VKRVVAPAPNITFDETPFPDGSFQGKQRFQVMRRIAILTAGGDTPALNATISGAVVRANALRIEVFGIIKGFSGMINPRVPHVHLNPLFSTIPELNPCLGGTLLGASRTYIHQSDTAMVAAVATRLEKLGIEGLICIGGDGTINGMQPLSQCFPTVLAPKTIDNDLGLNYAEEANEWLREPGAAPGKFTYRKLAGRPDLDLEEIVNYATPGYATAVYVAATGIQRIRTTAESHRRIAIIEVMGRDSGYIALGSAYGQPDIILLPESPINFSRLEQRVRELYELQKHVVIVVGEGVVDEQGNQLGAVSKSSDPAGNILFSGAAEHLKSLLVKSMGNDYFTAKRRNESADSAIFTRKLGHTQRGGRPILFDRFHAAQLGGKAVQVLAEGLNNAIVTLQWTNHRGFFVDSIDANKLRDQWGIIHPRRMHQSLYDAQRFQPSKLGIEYMLPIFTNAIGADDMEDVRVELFHAGNLTQRYQSVNVDIQKRIRLLD